MGVPRLFPWLVKRYKTTEDNSPIIHTTKLRQVLEVDTHSIDVLLIDANPLLYNAKMQIEGDIRGRYKSDNTTVFMLFFEQIKLIFKLVNPTTELFIALDGVAPQAKQAQQRVRRYISRPKGDSMNGISPLNFSPGTEFMELLNQYMIDKLSKKPFGDVLVKYSSYRKPGEGEHKCVEYIRKHKDIGNLSFSIYGPDGDLLWLALGLNYLSPKRVSVIREVPDETCGYYYIDTTNIYTKMIKIEKIRVNDLIFIANLVGNDFLEKIQQFVFLEDGMDMLITNMKGLKIIKEYGSTVTLNIKDLMKLVKVLSDNQNSMLVSQKNKQFEYLKNFYELEDDPSLMKMIDDDIVELEMDKYSKKYYARFETHKTDRTGLKPTPKASVQPDRRSGLKPALPVHGGRSPPLKPTQDSVPETNDDEDKTSDDGSDIYTPISMTRQQSRDRSCASHKTRITERNRVCENYLNTMFFVYKYYMDTLPSWTFTYEYHYPPLMTDFYAYLNNLSKTITNYKYEFDMGTPSPPFVQLLSILPPEGKDMLPKQYHQVFELIKKEHEPVNVYPEEVYTDYRGKLNEYEGVVILPKIERFIVDRLYEKYSTNKYIRNTLN